MKGVRATDCPSLVKGAKRKAERSVLNFGSVPASHNRSLYVAVEGTKDEHPCPQVAQASEGEHQLRLARLGEQVGRLAHDIRNPLASIEWFTSLLGRDDQSQAERLELADHCIRAVRTLDHLVSNMLIFSAPLHAKREPVHLPALLNDVELLALYPLRSKRLTIYRYCENNVSTIWGQESLLKQVLLNLFMNAIYASKPDSFIEIHCRNESRLVEQLGKQKSEHGLLLRIRDHGCGMSEEERSHMFRPFYSNRKGGTGLGLSIVQQIVHIHHGFIDITSQQGKGTTVDLFFPQ